MKAINYASRLTLIGIVYNALRSMAKYSSLTDEQLLVKIHSNLDKIIQDKKLQ